MLLLPLPLWLLCQDIAVKEATSTLPRELRYAALRRRSGFMFFRRVEFRAI
jgi:hypothetical protein